MEISIDMSCILYIYFNKLDIDINENNFPTFIKYEFLEEIFVFMLDYCCRRTCNVR